MQGGNSTPPNRTRRHRTYTSVRRHRAPGASGWRAQPRTTALRRNQLTPEGSPQTCRLPTGWAQSCRSGWRRIARTKDASEARGLPSKHSQEKPIRGTELDRSEPEQSPSRAGEGLGLRRRGPSSGGLRETLGLGSSEASAERSYPPPYPSPPHPRHTRLEGDCPRQHLRPGSVKEEGRERDRKASVG